jgi:hypothetical protein
MAVFVEMDFEGFTTDQYDMVNDTLDPKGNPPDGLIAHSARLDGDTLRILDLWESPEAFGAFAESRIGPTMAETLGDDAPAVPDPKFTELHNAYSV